MFISSITIKEIPQPSPLRLRPGIGRCRPDQEFERGRGCCPRIFDIPFFVLQHGQLFRAGFDQRRCRIGMTLPQFRWFAEISPKTYFAEKKRCDFFPIHVVKSSGVRFKLRWKSDGQCPRAKGDPPGDHENMGFIRLIIHHGKSKCHKPFSVSTTTESGYWTLAPLAGYNWVNHIASVSV